jgi:hypothetical protein
VRRVAIRVQEQDRHRFDAVLHRLGDDVAHLIFVDRDQHPALGIHPLTNFVASRPLDQWNMALEEEVIGFRPVDPTDLIDVAKSLCRQQDGPRAAAFEDRVDRNGRAMQKKLRFGKARSRLADTRGDTVDQTARGRERFAEPQGTRGLVVHGDIGERAADIRRQPCLMFCWVPHWSAS